MKYSLVFSTLLVFQFVVVLDAKLSGTWSKFSLSIGRAYIQTAVVGKYALFGGGSSLGGLDNSDIIVDIYDSELNTWNISTFAVPHMYGGTTTIGPFAMFAGGSSAATFKTSNVIDVWNSNNQSWSNMFLSSARTGITATTVGHIAMFAGGVGPAGVSGVVDIYNYKLNSWSNASLSEPRTGITSVTIDHLAIFAGGSPYEDGGQTNVIDIFNLFTNSWTTALLGTARVGMAATVVGTTAIFGGGGGNGVPFQKEKLTLAIGEQESIVFNIDMYKLHEHTWTSSNLSHPRTLLSATTIGNLALFAGGMPLPINETIANPGASSVIDIYDFETSSWSTDTLPRPRYALSAVTVGNRAIFAGGISNTTGVTADIDIYTAESEL